MVGSELLSSGRLEEFVSLTQTLIKQWHEIFAVFQNTTGNTPADSAGDQTFLSIKSAVMRQQQALFRAVPDDYPFGRNIQGILARLVSLDQVRTMPHSQRRNIERDWHAVFVRLWVLLGRLEQMRRGAVLDESGPPGALTTETEGEKSKKKTLLIAVVVIVIAAVAVWFYMQSAG